MNIILNKLNLLFLILFLLMAFPGWYIGPLRVSVIIVIFLVLIFVIYNKKFILKNFQKMCKSRCAKLVFLLTFWIIITGIIVSFFSRYTIIDLVQALGTRYIPLILIPFFAGFIVSQNYPNRTMSFYYYFIIFVLLMGGVDCLLSLIKIEFFQKLLIKTIVNHYATMHTDFLKATFMGIPRIQSVFDEPSFFAFFICIHLPLIFNLSKSDIRLFKSNSVNYTIKKILPFYTFLMLFATMSPIFLCFGIIITTIYYLIKNKKRTILNLLFIAFFAILFIIYKFADLNIDLSNTFLIRITNTINNISDFKSLLANSPSLATRIIHYINSFFIFLNHPIWGAGFGGIKYSLYEQLCVSPVILSQDTLITMLTSGTDDAITSYNPSIFWQMIAEIGLIGILILYSIFFFVAKRIKNYLSHAFDKNSYLFMDGLFYAIIIIIVLSIYNSFITDSIIWSILGIGSGFYYKYRPILVKNQKFILGEGNNDVREFKINE